MLQAVLFSATLLSPTPQAPAQAQEPAERTWLIVLPEAASDEPEVISIDSLPSGETRVHRTSAGDDIEISRDADGHALRVNGKTIHLVMGAGPPLPPPGGEGRAFFFRSAEKAPPRGDTTIQFVSSLDASGPMVHVQTLALADDGPQVVVISKRAPAKD